MLNPFSSEKRWVKAEPASTQSFLCLRIVDIIGNAAYHKAPFGEGVEALAAIERGQDKEL